jgi:signal transduction histidine kinase/ligand-binding sensor domain-containing protein
MEDNAGRIWFLKSTGFGVIDPRKGTLGFMDDITGQRNDISKMVKDEAGRIWICNTSKGGLLIINPDSLTYKLLDKKAGLSGTQTYGIAIGQDKNIWVSTTDNGISIINTGAGKISYLQKAAGLINDSLSTLAIDKTGLVWTNYSGNSSEQAVYAINIKKGLITRYGSQQGVINRYVINILPDSAGRIWVCTSREVEIIDPQNGTYKYLERTGGDRQQFIAVIAGDNQRIYAGTVNGFLIIEQNGNITKPIGNENIISMLQDAEGNIWAGTDKGIDIINLQKKTVKNLQKQQGLSNNFIQSFTEVDGKMWVASNGGLDVIDPVAKTMAHYGEKEGFANDTVFALMKDNKGNVWFTTPSSGIDFMDAAKTMVKHASMAEGLSDDDIGDVKQDSQGLIWVATYRGGVDVIDPQDGTIKNLSDAPGLKDLNNKVLLTDKDGRIWIGTSQGIYVADTKQNTLTAITTAEGLTNNNVTSLLQYDGKVLAAVNNRVSVITPPSNTGGEWHVEPLNNSENLDKEVASSWNTNAIASTGQYLWGDSTVTIIHAIKGYSSTNLPVYISGVELMGQHLHFFDISRVGGNDTIWANDTFYVKGPVPQAAWLGNQEGLSWDSLSGPYNMPVNLHLPYNKNFMQFQFVQANGGRRQDALYCYMLQGLDKRWSAITPNPYSENYLNLPPGQYTFKVRSKGLNGKWGTPAAFSFTITPPWYKTWWAYALYVLVIFFAIRGYVLYRSRKLIEENLFLEEKVKQRTDALQKSLEELKNTQTQLVQSEKMASLGELTAGIAHEIQNPLNFVNNFSEVSVELVDELKDELAKVTMDSDTSDNISALLDDLVQNQQKINFHGKRADSIVKGMLQHSRANSGQKEWADVNQLADEFLRLSYHGLRAKDKTFNAKLETAFDAALPKVNMVSQDVGRVLVNIFTNAFYSVMKKKAANPDNYQPTVKVTTEKKGNFAEIRIWDNGLGIPQNVLDKIYNPFFTTKPTGEGTGLGLSLSYEIITKGHGGTIHVETKEGEFAEFIILLPL